ncbi:MAG: hypothetical protein ACK4NF_01305 [Planctomycetota bacterium]
MKKAITKLFFILCGLLAGFIIGYYKYTVELKRATSQIKDIAGEAKFETFEDLVRKLKKEFEGKEKILNQFKVDIEKMEKKLTNLENQYSDLVNSLLKQAGAQKEEISSLVWILKPKNSEEKKPSEDLVKEIETALEDKDWLVVLRLLKKLAGYGTEYYHIIFNTLQKVYKNIAGKIDQNFFSLGVNKLNYYRELGSNEFVNFYKWVIENPEIAIDDKIIATQLLGWAGGEEVKSYLFSQFKKQKNPVLHEKLFLLLSDCPEYKNEFISIAKDFSRDVKLRRRIVLEYVDDNSQEVIALFNFLKNTEQDEQIKEIISKLRRK